MPLWPVVKEELRLRVSWKKVGESEGKPEVGLKDLPDWERTNADMVDREGSG